MKIYSETSLKNFEFWSGARDRADVLTDEQFKTIEACLEDGYPEGMEDVEINDLFWHYSDTIADWLGFSSFEALEIYNTEGEHYYVAVYVDGEERIVLDEEFDSRYDAECWVDDNIRNTEAFQKCDESIDVYIYSNLTRDDEEEYEAYYKEEEEDEE